MCGRDLTGIKADFLFFMSIAAICFSGLLFTLWELAQLERGDHWTVQSIAWLMTQVWFGKEALLVFILDSSMLLSGIRQYRAHL